MICLKELIILIMNSCFDAKCEINVQYKHILSDEENMKRIVKYKSENLQYIFSGAIDMMKRYLRIIK